jgi:thioredoxin reductase
MRDFVMKDLYDVIVVGGGPAGLNATLILARCLRKVLLFDHGKPRNRWAVASHGFLSRDGINPLELLRISREQLQHYKVEIKPLEIVSARKEQNFIVKDEHGEEYYAKKLLIATGLKDLLPKIPGFERLYGKSVFHCPYCDGFENRFTKIAAYGFHKSAVGLAISLTNWSNDVILFSDGRKLSNKDQEILDIHGVSIISKKIERLEGDEYLRGIVLEEEDFIPRNAVFFTTEQYQRSHIAEELGCKFSIHNMVETNNFQQTNVEGLYVAGDAGKDAQLMIIAAAEGAKAAVIINKSFQKEELKSITLDAELKH